MHDRRQIFKIHHTAALPRLLARIATYLQADHDTGAQYRLHSIPQLWLRAVRPLCHPSGFHPAARAAGLHENLVLDGHCARRAGVPAAAECAECMAASGRLRARCASPQRGQLGARVLRSVCGVAGRYDSHPYERVVSVVAVAGYRSVWLAGRIYARCFGLPGMMINI